jgi:2-haloacid dehalogenase
MSSEKPGAEGSALVPKVLAFDVFGTVVDWHTSIAREAEAIIPGIDGDAFANEWRKGYAPAMAATMAAGTFRLLDDLHMEILIRIAPPGVSEEQLQQLNTAWHRLDPWPEAVEGLTRLKRRFIVTTLSNGGIGLLTHMAKRAGLPWDVILCAEVFQAYKPDHRVYRGAARVLGVEPNEVMMVAAHHTDLDAAQDAGLGTAYIERLSEFGAAQPKDIAPQPRHALHFKDLNALADYFGC